jgi:hypothetical protein
MNPTHGIIESLGDDVAVLGALSPFTSGPGAAWVFCRSGGTWSEVTDLVGDDSLDGDDFGASLDLGAGLLAVGAPARLGESGAVYLFEAGGAWPQVARIEGAHPASRFGASLAVAPDLLVVGAPRDDLAALDGGAVHVLTVKPALENYCTATTNSSLGAARMSATGSTSVGSNDLILAAEPVPAGQPGLFYYGAQEALVPFGNGFRCVGPGAGALYRLPIQSAVGNRLSHALDLDAPPLSSGQVLPGSTWHFQAWFRDPFAAGSFFNLSDGLRARFLR